MQTTGYRSWARAIWVSLAALVWVWPAPVFAHIGSPNVFFEGQAGPYPMTVVIRPPATLPGSAEVDIRGPSGPTLKHVAVQAIYAAASPDAAPPAVEARPVTGDPGLRSAACWLLARGAYVIRIVVEGSGGTGTVSVPLQAAPTQAPAMPGALVAGLLGASLLLVLGALAIATAAAREAVLPREASPTAADHRRARQAGLATGLLLAGVIGLGAERWRRLDREFQSTALARPVAVQASLAGTGEPRVLRLVPTPENLPTTHWNALVTDHGKLAHLFVVKDDGQGEIALAHLHPVRRDNATLECVLPPLPGGKYHVYGDLTYANGRTETLLGSIALPASSVLARRARRNALEEVWCRAPVAIEGNDESPTTLDYDDAWREIPEAPEAGARVSHLSAGARMVFETPGPITANREETLRFTVVEAGGERVALRPYMGMEGHAAVRKCDGQVFAHLHPAGSVSMAAQQLLDPAAVRMATEPGFDATEVRFPYAFPRAGEYRVWVEVRTSAGVETGVFSVAVGEEK